MVQPPVPRYCPAATSYNKVQTVDWSISMVPDQLGDVADNAETKHNARKILWTFVAFYYVFMALGRP